MYLLNQNYLTSKPLSLHYSVCINDAIVTVLGKITLAVLIMLLSLISIFQINVHICNVPISNVHICNVPICKQRKQVFIVIIDTGVAIRYICNN